MLHVGTNGLFARQCQHTGLSWRKMVVEKIGLSDRMGCEDRGVGGGGRGSRATDEGFNSELR